MVKKRQPISRKKQIWLIVISLVVVLMAFLWILHFTSKWRVLRIADQLQPGSSWVLTDEYVQPFRIICIDNSAQCPSMYRNWELQEPLTYEQFDQLLSESGFDFPIEGDCERDPGASGSVRLCSASGTVSGMEVTVGMGINDYSNEKIRVGISIR